MKVKSEKPKLFKLYFKGFYFNSQMNLEGKTYYGYERAKNFCECHCNIVHIVLKVVKGIFVTRDRTFIVAVKHDFAKLFSVK